MPRTVLDDATWASLMLIVQRIPHAWKKNEARLRLFVEAVLWIDRTGAPWRDLPGELGRWPSVFHRFRRWRRCGWWEMVFEAGRPCVPGDGFVAADSTTCKAQRAATGAARSCAPQEALGRSRGGLGSKIHACVDGAGRVLRVIISPSQHSDLRYAAALMADIPVCEAALDRAYVCARLRQALALSGCTAHTPPEKDMLSPPSWNPAVDARRHSAENFFSRLKDFARIARRRDKTRQSWIGFIHLASALINLHVTQFSHRA
jgi:transposase